MKITGQVILLLTILSCSNHEDKHPTLNPINNATIADVYGFLNYILMDSTDIGFVNGGHKIISDIEDLPPPSVLETASFRDFLCEELNETDTSYILKQVKERKGFRTDGLQEFGFTIVKVSDLRKEKLSREEFWEIVYNNFGPGYFTVSRPVFNRRFTKVYVRIGYLCGPLCGAGEDFIMKKVNGKWMIAKRLNSWMS